MTYTPQNAYRLSVSRGSSMANLDKEASVSYVQNRIPCSKCNCGKTLPPQTDIQTMFDLTEKMYTDALKLSSDLSVAVKEAQGKQERAMCKSLKKKKLKMAKKIKKIGTSLKESPLCETVRFMRYRAFLKWYQGAHEKRWGRCATAIFCFISGALVIFAHHVVCTPSNVLRSRTWPHLALISVLSLVLLLFNFTLFVSRWSVRFSFLYTIVAIGVLIGMLSEGLQFRSLDAMPSLQIMSEPKNDISRSERTTACQIFNLFPYSFYTLQTSVFLCGLFYTIVVSRVAKYYFLKSSWFVSNWKITKCCSIKLVVPALGKSDKERYKELVNLEKEFQQLSTQSPYKLQSSKKSFGYKKKNPSFGPHSTHKHNMSGLGIKLPENNKGLCRTPENQKTYNRIPNNSTRKPYPEIYNISMMQEAQNKSTVEVPLRLNDIKKKPSDCQSEDYYINERLRVCDGLCVECSATAGFTNFWRRLSFILCCGRFTRSRQSTIARSEAGWWLKAPTKAMKDQAKLAASQSNVSGKSDWKVTYIGETDTTGKPEGFGSWKEDGYSYGERLVGYWTAGLPNGPHKSRELGSGSGFMCIRIGWAKYNLTDNKLSFGVSNVECSVSGKFYRGFPTVQILEPPKFRPFYQSRTEGLSINVLELENEQQHVIKNNTEQQVKNDLPECQIRLIDTTNDRTLLFHSSPDGLQDTTLNSTFKEASKFTTDTTVFSPILINNNQLNEVENQKDKCLSNTMMASNPKDSTLRSVLPKNLPNNVTVDDLSQLQDRTNIDIDNQYYTETAQTSNETPRTNAKLLTTVPKHPAKVAPPQKRQLYTAVIHGAEFPQPLLNRDFFCSNLKFESDLPFDLKTELMPSDYIEQSYLYSTTPPTEISIKSPNRFSDRETMYKNLTCHHCTLANNPVCYATLTQIPNNNTPDNNDINDNLANNTQLNNYSGQASVLSDPNGVTKVEELQHGSNDTQIYFNSSVSLAGNMTQQSSRRWNRKPFQRRLRLSKFRNSSRRLATQKSQIPISSTPKDLSWYSYKGRSDEGIGEYQGSGTRRVFVNRGEKLKKFGKSAMHMPQHIMAGGVAAAGAGAAVLRKLRKRNFEIIVRLGPSRRDVLWCLAELSPHTPNFGIQPRSELVISVDYDKGLCISGYIPLYHLQNREQYVLDEENNSFMPPVDFVPDETEEDVCVSECSNPETSHFESNRQNVLSRAPNIAHNHYKPLQTSHSAIIPLPVSISKDENEWELNYLRGSNDGTPTIKPLRNVSPDSQTPQRIKPDLIIPDHLFPTQKEKPKGQLSLVPYGSTSKNMSSQSVNGGRRISRFFEAQGKRIMGIPSRRTNQLNQQTDYYDDVSSHTPFYERRLSEKRDHAQDVSDLKIRVVRRQLIAGPANVEKPDHNNSSIGIKPTPDQTMESCNCSCHVFPDKSDTCSIILENDLKRVPDPDNTFLYQLNLNTAKLDPRDARLSMETPELEADGWLCLDAAGSPEVLIYIHGYNNSHIEALQILGQMAAFGNYPNHIRLFLFTWPAGSGFWQFFKAVKAAEHPKTHAALADVLKALRDNGIRQIHIMCHSMGSRLFLRSFRKFADILFQEVDPTATLPNNPNLSGNKKTTLPDKLTLATVTFLNPEYFLDEFVLEDYPILRRFSNHISIYADEKDQALWWSETLSRHRALGKTVFGLWRPVDLPVSSSFSSAVLEFKQAPHFLNTVSFFHYTPQPDPRLGTDGRNKNENGIEWLDIDVIDTTFMDQNVHSMRHSFWNLNRGIIEDIRELMVTRKRARQRIGRLDRRDGNVWVYRVAPSFLTSLFEMSI